MFNKFNNLGKKIRTEEEEKKDDTKKVSATPTSDKEKARKQLLKLVAIISGGFVVILLIVLIGTAVIGTDHSYDQIEQILKNAAIKYYQVQDVLLPS